MFFAITNVICVFPKDKLKLRLKTLESLKAFLKDEVKNTEAEVKLYIFLN